MILPRRLPALPEMPRELLEAVVVRLQLVVADREILDRHFLGDGVLAVALREMAAQQVVGRLQPPGSAVPVLAGAAEPGARQERAEPPERQRRLGRRVAQRHRLGLGVLEQLLPHRIFEVVAHRGDGEILARRAHGAALEAHDGEPGLGELARQDRAGPAHPDHHRVDFLEHRGHSVLPRCCALTRASSAFRAPCVRPPWSSARGCRRGPPPRP